MFHAATRGFECRHDLFQALDDGPLTETHFRG